MSYKSILASLIVAAGVAATPAIAQDVTLRMSTAAPEKTIWQKQFDQFAADVAEETEGRVAIEIFYNSQLGPENTVLPQVMRGRIDMGAFSTAGLADQLRDAYLVSMLFYYDDHESRSCMLDTVREDYRELIAPTGLRLVDWTEVGSFQISGKQAFTTPDTIDGLRLGGAANPITNLFWERMGAFPNLVAVTEAASSISTGLIDVYPTIPVFYIFAGISQVAPVLTKVDIGIPPGVIVINDAVWEGLSDENKAGIERALARHPAAERSAQFYAFEDQLYQLHQSKGGTVAVATAEERAMWREGIDEYYAQVLEESSPEGLKFWAALEAAKASCTK